MTEDIKHRLAIVAECQGAIKRRLDDIDRMAQLDVRQADEIRTQSGHVIGSVTTDLLREVLHAGCEVMRRTKLEQIAHLESRIVEALARDVVQEPPTC
jgi:hypothetical protein